MLVSKNKRRGYRKGDLILKAIKLYEGDYVKLKKAGGQEFFGDVRKIWENGIIDIAPDGNKKPIPVKSENVLGLERGGRLRDRAEYTAKEPQWKYEEYSDWSRLIAKNYTRAEIEKEVGITNNARGKLADSHRRAIEKSTSMQSSAQGRAQSGNAMRGNYERFNAHKNALEIYDYYPEKTKEGVKPELKKSTAPLVEEEEI